MNIDKTEAVVYSKENCPWCEKAIRLLRENEISVKELKLGVDYSKEHLIQLIGTTKQLTVPQIFIDDQHIGGYDHLNSYFSMAQSVKQGA